MVNILCFPWWNIFVHLVTKTATLFTEKLEEPKRLSCLIYRDRAMIMHFSMTVAPSAIGG